MSDIETRLARVLREQADSVDFDPHEWSRRVAAAPAPKRRFPMYAAGLAAAAALAGAVVLSGTLLDRAPHPPASSSATSATVPVDPDRFAPVVGVWRLMKVDGTTLTEPDSFASAITLTHSGWWQAKAGCVTLGSFFAWDPATEKFAVEDWTTGGEVPPPAMAKCYLPAITAVLRPGTALSPLDEDQLVARDASGKEFARLMRTDAEEIVPFRGTQSSTWSIKALGTDSPSWLTGYEAKMGNAAPWLRVRVDVVADRITITTLRPAGSAPECTVDVISGRIDGRGRVDAVRALDPTPDAPRCGVDDREVAAVEAIRGVQALGTTGGHLSLLGAHGTTAAELALPSWEMTEEFMTVPAPADIVGDWWLDTSELGNPSAPGRVVISREGADLGFTLTTDCGTGSWTMRLAGDGSVDSRSQEKVLPACSAASRTERDVVRSLDSLSGMYSFGGRLLLVGDGRVSWVVDAPGLPMVEGAKVPTPSSAAGIGDLVGDWRLDWSRDEPMATQRGEARMTIAEDATAQRLRVSYRGCNEVTATQLVVGGWVVDSKGSTSLVGCGKHDAWVEGRVLHPASYALDLDGRLLFLSRSGAVMLAFTRAG
ncbi:hypothetical protein [Nostocoides jenkinsii]|uniref:Uncharacterized protein n=1 Tax=Nostocoides jenkinsii Ben 74 TaxID=1193518 RepID=A0A077ME32_9MICO|nr:hypothetical protein [Tetrasphaera jenkinsii]CCI54914.1 hypothetical protein BN13_890008 [Tetrasphaera jenkinsii Ben 74]